MSLTSGIRRVLTKPVPEPLRRRHRVADPEEAAAFRKHVDEYVERNRSFRSAAEKAAMVDTIVSGRLGNHRRRTVPWLAASVPLQEARVLEVGSGHGASTLALVEQGASVVATDIDEEALALCRARLASVGLKATTQAVNAKDLQAQFKGQEFDIVLFYASLEHMVTRERLEAIAAGFALAPGGYVAVAETPNRLWPYDSHTSKLPFFSWLPDDIAFEYSRHSPRPNIREMYGGSPSPESLLHFLRRGRGVSYHDFELALKKRASDLDVVSAMQLEQRGAVRTAAWAASIHGRTERLLRCYAPEGIHRGFFQPFLYLLFRASHTGV